MAGSFTRGSPKVNYGQRWAKVDYPANVWDKACQDQKSYALRPWGDNWPTSQSWPSADDSKRINFADSRINFHRFGHDISFFPSFLGENWMFASLDCRDRNCRPYSESSVRNITSECYFLCANSTRFRIIKLSQVSYLVYYNIVRKPYHNSLKSRSLNSPGWEKWHHGMFKSTYLVNNPYIEGL